VIHSIFYGKGGPQMNNTEIFYEEHDRAPDLAKATLHLAQQQTLQQSNQIEQLYREQYIIDQAIAGYKQSFYSHLAFLALLLVSIWFFEFDYLGNVAGLVFLLGCAAFSSGLFILILKTELQSRLLWEKIRIAERLRHYPSIIDGDACAKVDLDILRGIRRCVG
jgi:hypothetical protein